MSNNACGTPGCPAPSLEQWGQLCASIGRVEATLGSVVERLDALEAAKKGDADADADALRAEVAALKAERTRAADFRRDVGKAVAIALLSAALGVLGGAAAKGAPRTASPPTPTLGAGGAPNPYAYPPPPK